MNIEDDDGPHPILFTVRELKIIGAALLVMSALRGGGPDGDEEWHELQALRQRVKGMVER